MFTAASAFRKSVRQQRVARGVGEGSKCDLRGQWKSGLVQVITRNGRRFVIPGWTSSFSRSRTRSGLADARQRRHTAGEVMPAKASFANAPLSTQVDGIPRRVRHNIFVTVSGRFV